jgi:hypothetical protein
MNAISWLFVLLQVLFIALKLLGKLNWGWVWILCPLWGQLAFWLLVLALVILAFSVTWFWSNFRS